MVRASMALVVAILVLGVAGWISADETARRPLDLPSGGGSGEEDEDAPESITFYGAEFEAEAFFFCVDRSGSMVGQPMSTLKSEMGDAIGQLSRRSQFGIVSFGTTEGAWQERPMKATSSNKASAQTYIQGLVAFGWTCMPDAVAHVCQISNKCRLRNRAIILVGDGMPYCMSLGTLLTEETLSALATHNYRRTPVNTIFISADQQGIAFFRQIASLYNGEFRAVN